MPEIRENKYLRTTLFICIGLIYLFCLSAIIGWLWDFFLLSSFSNAYISMTPVTTLTFLMLGFVLIVYNYRHKLGKLMLLSEILIFISMVISFLIITEHFIGIRVNIERLLHNIFSGFESIPIGKMSHITAINFFLIDLSLILTMFSSDKKNIFKVTASYIATLVASIGMIIGLGYLYGTPLLYGGIELPVPLSTSIMFIFVAMGVIISLGKEYWPLSAVI